MYWMSLSTAYYPSLGVLIGYFGAFFFSFAVIAWNPTIAAVAYTLSTVWLTGAFHEDGLADTFDGFGGGWGKKQILEIMKDSRIGTYGCIGLVLIVLTKLSAVALLATMSSFSVHWLVAAHVMGRWACTYLLYVYEYVEGVSAPGKEFKMEVTWPRLLFATAVAFGHLWLAAPTAYVFCLVLLTVILTTIVAGRYINSVIDGVIGDCLGAANQVVEVIVYLTLACNFERVEGVVTELLSRL